MRHILIALAFGFFALPAYAQEWPIKPNWTVTPGLTRNLSLTKICNTKWGSDQRGVTAAMKQQVRDSYHFADSICPATVLKGKRTRRAEIDHLIPRSLGGADDVSNLWPQCYEVVKKDKSQQDWGAHKKDRLETYLHADVCKSRSVAKLQNYQQQFAHDWIALYRQIYADE